VERARRRHGYDTRRSVLLAAAPAVGGAYRLAVAGRGPAPSRDRGALMLPYILVAFAFCFGVHAGEIEPIDPRL
jgi:hypothetical protein